MYEFNKQEIEMIQRALFNQRLHSMERMKELEEIIRDNYLRRMSQECDDIKLINEILLKIEHEEQNEKG